MHMLVMQLNFKLGCRKWDVTNGGLKLKQHLGNQENVGKMAFFL